MTPPVVEAWEWTKLLVPVAASLLVLGISIWLARGQALREKIDAARQVQLDKIETRLQSLTDRILRVAEDSADEHAAVKAQVNDIALTVANNYVRQRDFNNALGTISAGLTEVRKEIGAVHNRIDDVFKRGWRGSDG